MLRFKALFFTLVSFLGFSAAIQAQIEEPVEWELSVVDNTTEGATLVFKASIEQGWHVYATVTSEDEKALLEGPLPTVLTVEKSDNYELIGDLQDTEFETHMEKVWGFELNFYDGTAEFRQDVKWKSQEPFFIKGDLAYMACNDEKCIFPDPVVFDFGINGATAEKKDVPSGILDPVSWSVASKDLGDGNYEIAMTGVCEQGWHYYATKLDSDEGPLPTWFNFENEGVYEIIGELNEPEPHKAYDPNFMMDLLFHEDATFTQKIKLTGSESMAKGSINFMVCNDEKCLPPKDVFWEVDVKTGTGSFLSETAMLDNEGGETTTFGENEDPFVIGTVDLENPLNECAETTGADSGEEEKDENSLWMTFLLGIGGGLLALLTPCVFPMIPLTVSFFTKGSEKGNGKARAALYGFFILMIYLLLSLPFHLSKNIDPEILNQISTHPVLNLAFFAVFVFFALSFFGYYEITLPSGLANKVDGASNAGGMIGIFFMALTLAIVSFSCTGPVLGGVIGSIYSDSSSVAEVVNFLGLELALPAAKVTAAMAGFGLALGGPFALFAAFPSLMSKMPKSGGWLNVVKVCLGFAELALAFKFLSNADLVWNLGIFKREIFFAVWIIIGIAWVVYMLGGIRFPHDSPNAKIGKGRWTVAIIVGLFTLYLMPGLTNTEAANRKLVSGFPPPLFYSIYDKGHGFTDYNEALAYAKENNKPLLVDFTGWACVNCRKMEEDVWVEDNIATLIQQDYVLVSLYVDEKVDVPEPYTYETRDKRKKKIKTVGNKWSTLQVETFKSNSQPMYALLSPDEKLLAPTRGYTPNADEYQSWLECGLEANKNLQAKAQK